LVDGLAPQERKRERKREGEEGERERAGKIDGTV